jgi:hypothetical protein
MTGRDFELIGMPLVEPVVLVSPPWLPSHRSAVRRAPCAVRRQEFIAETRL